MKNLRLLIVFISVINFNSGCKTESHNSHFGTLFSIDNIVNSKNENISMDEILTNKYVIIDYWFSQCKPCIREMQLIPEILEENMSLSVISIARDFDYNWEVAIVPNNLFPKHENWKHFRINLDKDKSPKAFLNGLEIQMFPTYILLNKDGKILETSNHVNNLVKRISKIKN